ncbi:hypothetical protein CMO91_00435, partial [Candidatus Woesearchaeota archaeon]|nr:hypothetical protein [Candidatus Woesearchaeota archaeon]
KNPDLTEYRAQLTERIALYNQAGGIYTTQLKTLYQEKRRVEAEQAARAAGVETTNDIGNVLTEETEGGAEKAKQNRDALRGRFHDAKTIDADVQDEPAAEPEAEAEPEARAYSDFAIPVYAVLNSSNRSFEAYQAAKEKLDNAPEDVEAPGPISAAARASFDREYKAAGLKEVQNQLGAGNTDKALEAYQNVRDMIGDETVQVEVEYKTRFGRKKIRTETVLVRDQLDQKTGYTAE